MTIENFINDDFFTLPKSQPPKEDFKLFSFRIFDKFIEKLENIRNEHNGFENTNFSIDLLIERQKHLVNSLKESIDYSYDGKPAKAFNSLNKGLNSDLKQFDELLNTRKFINESNFYRIRVHKQNFPLNSQDLFHIPYQHRGKVKTQRFSIPGFPSLYLGTTVYVCWEELNRPSINDFQAVRLKNIEPINVIDLSPPKRNSDTYEHYKYLMVWPLVFASSIKVRNNDDFFKPEYIIPQLLLQWVREKEEIDGISYQTTHIDYSKTLSRGEFLNIVLPVKDNKIRGICSSLQRKFEMTEVTSIQLNQCSTGGGTFTHNDDERLNSNIQQLELINGRAYPYAYSIFGDLERVLLYMRTKRI